MPFWLTIVIIAHLLNAFAFLVDKFLLSNVVASSRAYAFVVGCLSSFVIVAIPFGVTWLPLREGLLNIVTGALFICALLCFFEALKRGEVSRVVTYIGATTPLWILVFSFVFLQEQLAVERQFAFILLLVGSAMISYDSRAQQQSTNWFWVATCAALAFAVSQTLRRYLFTMEPFLTSFVWQAFGTAIVAGVLLLVRSSRKDIMATIPIFKTGKGLLFLAGQVLGATGFILLSYAVSLESATIVQALQGVQYAFLILFALVGSMINPKILREQFTPSTLSQKIFAVCIIGAALVVLARK